MLEVPEVPCLILVALGIELNISYYYIYYQCLTKDVQISWHSGKPNPILFSCHQTDNIIGKVSPDLTDIMYIEHLCKIMMRLSVKNKLTIFDKHLLYYIKCLKKCEFQISMLPSRQAALKFCLPRA